MLDNQLWVSTLIDRSGVIGSLHSTVERRSIPRHHAHSQHHLLSLADADMLVAIGQAVEKAHCVCSFSLDARRLMLISVTA